MRTLGARQGSTRRLTFRRRLAAGAALCIATTTAAVVGANVPALANVSTPAVTPSRSSAGALSNYTINFSTTVALVADTDTITIVAAGTAFSLVAADYTINGTAPIATPTGGAGNVTIKTHTLINAGAVSVVASRMTNPAAGSQTLTVATSKEATAVTSSSYVITAATAVSSVVLSTLSPAKAGSTIAQYTVLFAVATPLISSFDTITLTAPFGTIFPLTAGDYLVTAGGTQHTENLAPTQTLPNNVTLNVPPGSTGGGTTLAVQAFGVTNPPVNATNALTVSTSADITAGTSGNYAITAATAVTAVSVAPARLAAGASTTYTIAFTDTTTLATTDTITIAGPGNTVFPLAASNYTVADGLGAAVPVVTTSHVTTHDITLTVPVAILAAHTVTVVATGVVNTTTTGATTTSVATTQDTTPVTGGYTISAATAVTAVSVAPARLAAGASTTYTTAFADTTALATTDTITIAGPGNTVFPLAASNYTVADGLGAAVLVVTTSHVTTHDITLTVPVAILATHTVTVVATGVVNTTTTGATNTTVATSQDSTPVNGPYTISAATAVIGVAASPIPLTAAAPSTYTLSFSATTALVAASGTITIASAGTTFPAVIGSVYTVQDGAGLATAVTVGISGANTVTITTPVTVAAASVVVVVITGVTNPGVGSSHVSVSTSQDTTPVVSNSYPIDTSVGATVTAAVTPTTTLVAATYTVTFVATTALATTDTIAITAPTGTVFVLNMANYAVSDNSAAAVTAVVTPTHAASPADVVVRVPVAIAAGHTVTLVATGVTNPVAGTDTLTAATSKDTAAITSGTYAITAVVSSGGGGAPPTVPATPVRLSGSDRFGTAIAASMVEFPTARTAGAVVLARSDDYPDALVGTSLTAAKNAPLLFANGGLLTPATQVEIQRVLPAGGTVYLLGGTAAVPSSVATTLTSLGFVPVRYAGADRFATALAVADALNDPSTVLLATGINFPDALAAGPAAAHVHGVVLLTNGSAMTPAVTAYLAAHPGTVYAIGGPAVAADPSATTLSGADRYATAAMVASSLFTGPANVGLASGTAFPDALSGGAFQAHFGGPIVLSDPHVLPASTSAYLTAADSTIVTTSIFGGTAALSVTVQTAIATALGL